MTWKDNTKTKGKGKGFAQGYWAWQVQSPVGTTEVERLKKEVEKLKADVSKQKLSSKKAENDPGGDIICPECSTAHHNHKMVRCRACKATLKPGAVPTPRALSDSKLKDPFLKTYHKNLLSGMGARFHVLQEEEDQQPKDAEETGTIPAATPVAQADDIPMEAPMPLQQELRTQHEKTLAYLRSHQPTSPLIKVQEKLLRIFPRRKNPCPTSLSTML